MAATAVNTQERRVVRRHPRCHVRQRVRVGVAYAARADALPECVTVEPKHQRPFPHVVLRRIVHTARLSRAPILTVSLDHTLCRCRDQIPRIVGTEGHDTPSIWSCVMMPFRSAYRMDWIMDDVPSFR